MVTRHERVVLELDDRFSTGVARAAAETAILDRNLDSLDGNAVRANRSTSALGSPNGGIQKTGTASRKAGADIDRYSGRLSLLATTAATLGPALLPLGASVVPALSGLTFGLGAAAGAAGVTALAFSGLGEAMDAFSKYEAEPTTENLAAMEEQMDKIGASGAEFIKYLDSLEPELRSLQIAARDGLLPGVEDSINEMVESLPGVRRFVSEISETLGGLAGDAGRSLTSDSDWAAFFNYLKTDGAPALDSFGRSLGNLAAGMANLMTSFAPLTRDFTGGLLDMSEAFREWAAGLSNSETFQDFIEYVRQSAPQAADFLGSLTDSVVALAQAFAPWGSMVLPALSSLLDVVTAIAGSDIGPTLATVGAGMLLMSRASRALGSVMPKVTGGFTSMASSIRTLPADIAAVRSQMGMIGPATAEVAAAQGRIERLGGAARNAAGVAGMLALSSGATQAEGAVGALASTATGAAIGFSVGGPWGAAIGGAIGLVTSLGESNDEAAERVGNLTASFDQQTGAITENTRVMVAKNLQDQGLLDDAERLGLSTQLVTQAVMGQADAQAALNAELAKHGTSGAITSAEDMARSYSDAAIKTELADRAATNLRDSIPGLTDEFSEASKEARQLAEAQGGSARSMRGAGNAARFETVSLAELTAQQRTYADETLKSIDAGTRFGQALANAQKQVDKGTRGFSRFTEAGRANREAISQLIGAYNGQSEALKNNVGEYNRARGNVQKLAKQMGLTKAQTDRLTDALNKPKKIRIDDRDAANAREMLRRLGEDVSNLNGREAVITVRRRIIGASAAAMAAAASGNPLAMLAANAEGGLWRDNVRQYADGGMDRANAHQPEIASGSGPVRVWAEPETQGEAYIPLANDYRRPRAKSIAEETVSLLGGNVEWYANGGRRGGRGGGIGRGGRGGAADRAAASLRRLERASRRLERQVSREREEREKWVSKRNEVRSSTRSALQRDIWGSNANVFGGEFAPGSPGYAMQQLRRQRSEAVALKRAIQKLRRKGLNGGAVGAIMNSPDPLGTAQALAELPASQVREYERLYRSAGYATSQAGKVAGDAAFGQEVRQQTREIRETNRRLDRVEKAIKKKSKDDDRSRGKHSRDNARNTGKAVSNSAGAGKRRQRYGK